MSSDWRTLTIGQLGRVVTGKTPKTSDPDNFGGQIPFVTPTDMDGRKTISTTARYLSELGASTVNSSIIPAGSVMVSCIGSDMGKSVIAKHRCVTNQQINSIVVEAQFSSEFVYYNLSMRKAELQHLASGGSTMPILNKGMFSQLKLDLPPLAEQLRIVETLSALDDRITLLRETNATLEAIAQALFKSLFVDFDPVRAKMEGRAPEGMDEATAALFPDSLEESDLGLVPKGWRFGTVGAYARQHKGSINPLKSPDVVFEHFSLPAFDNQQMPVSELGFEIKSNKTSVPPDAVLLSKLNPHIPRIWLPVAVGDHAVCSTEFLVFVPALNSGATKEFIYCAFTTDKFKELLCQLVTGTSNSHQRVKPDGVSTMSAVIPSPLVLQAFGSLVQPIFERIGHNRNKTQTLATLRDTLLPRLISGQLRLPEAQAAAEEALA